MKDYLIQLVAERPPAVDGTNLMREYVQSRILDSLQGSKAMLALAFHGGTALRFLYRIGRFSEDLDFALERPEAGYDFGSLVEQVRRDLEAEGYTIRLRVNDQAVVNKALVGFVGLPGEVGLSPHGDQVFWVKIEVDTNPPAGAGLQTTVVRGFAILRLQHHDLPSLFAGKLAAVLMRKYTKGRDLYDLVWYLTDRKQTEPNLTMLANSLRQREPGYPAPGAAAWRGVVLERLRSVDWGAARTDVARFLERPNEVELLSLETFEPLLRSGI